MDSYELDLIWNFDILIFLPYLGIIVTGQLKVGEVTGVPSKKYICVRVFSAT